MRSVLNRSILTFVFLLFQHHIFANYYITKGCESALLEILNLRLDKATEILTIERHKHPNNYYIDYVENYKELVELLILEDKQSYEAYLERFYMRLDEMEENKPSSPFYRMVRAEMLCQSGLLNIMYGDEISGFWKIYKANKLLKDNHTKYPDFEFNNKLSGIFNVAFDNIPISVRWASKMLGFDGNTELGFSKLISYKNEISTHTALYSESLIYLIFAYRIVSDDDNAYQLLRNEYANSDGTIIGDFLYAVILYRTGRNEESLQVLYALNVNEMDRPFYPIVHLIAREKMNRLDPDTDIYWLNYLQNSKNENLKKETCNKLSLFYLMNNEHDLYLHYKNLVSKFDQDVMQEDMEADVDIQRQKPLNLDLIKAHFLISGSYYTRADSVLQFYSLQNETKLANKIQYYLFKGEIYSHLNDIHLAFNMFDQAISQGQNISESYSAEAALHAGILAHKNGDYKRAYQYYKQCKSIDCDFNVYRETINKKLLVQMNKLEVVYNH